MGRRSYWPGTNRRGVSRRRRWGRRPRRALSIFVSVPRRRRAVGVRRAVAERIDPSSSQHLLPGAPDPVYPSNPPTSGAHRPGAHPTGALAEPIEPAVQVTMLEARRRAAAVQRSVHRRSAHARSAEPGRPRDGRAEPVPRRTDRCDRVAVQDGVSRGSTSRTCEGLSTPTYRKCTFTDATDHRRNPPVGGRHQRVDRLGPGRGRRVRAGRRAARPVGHHRPAERARHAPRRHLRDARPRRPRRRHRHRRPQRTRRSRHPREGVPVHIHDADKHMLLDPIGTSGGFGRMMGDRTWTCARRRSSNRSTTARS